MFYIFLCVSRAEGFGSIWVAFYFGSFNGVCLAFSVEKKKKKNMVKSKKKGLEHIFSEKSLKHAIPNNTTGELSLLQ